MCGIQEAGIKPALGPSTPQASHMGSLIAHICVGVLETDLFYISWKTKPVSDRPGWFHLRILRIRKACNYKNSYGCFSFFFFSSRNKSQAPCYCFSAFVPPHSALQGGCHFTDEKWSCSDQVTCPRPWSWYLIELNFEFGFHTIFHQSPLSPVSRLLR